jgi:hypothetical protein
MLQFFYFLDTHLLNSPSPPSGAAVPVVRFLRNRFGFSFGLSGAEFRRSVINFST